MPVVQPRTRSCEAHFVEALKSTRDGETICTRFVFRLNKSFCVVKFFKGEPDRFTVKVWSGLSYQETRRAWTTQESWEPSEDWIRHAWNCAVEAGDILRNAHFWQLVRPCQADTPQKNCDQRSLTALLRQAEEEERFLRGCWLD